MPANAYLPAGCSDADVSRAADPGPELPSWSDWMDASFDAIEQRQLINAFLSRMDWQLVVELQIAESLPPESCKRVLMRFAERMQETFEKMAREGKVTL